MILDLLAAVVIGVAFTAVAFAVWLRSADKAVEK